MDEDGKVFLNGEADEGDSMDDFMSMLLRGAASAPHDDERGDDGDDDALLFFTSTDDARNAVSGVVGPVLASRISRDRLHQRRVVEWVLDHQDEISGDAADWHNLVNPFFECDDYCNAMKIARAGLRRFPRDATLLGDAIRSAGQLGNWDDGNALLKEACDHDFRSGEDWSLSVYVKDYLMARARSEDSATRTKTYNEALGYLREAKSRIPMSDRLINSEAEVLLEAGRIEEARDLLEDAIFMDDYKDGSLNPERHPVPQCCLTYLNEILSQSCDYDKIIDICDAGIRFSAEEKKSVSVGYFFYRKALAMDGQIIANGSGARAQGIGNQDYVRNALRTYSLASMLTEASSYRAICRERFIILCALGGIDDMNVNDYIKDNEK